MTIFLPFLSCLWFCWLFLFLLNRTVTQRAILDPYFILLFYLLGWVIWNYHFQDVEKWLNARNFGVAIPDMFLQAVWLNPLLSRPKPLSSVKGHSACNVFGDFCSISSFMTTSEASLFLWPLTHVFLVAFPTACSFLWFHLSFTNVKLLSSRAWWIFTHACPYAAAS